MYVLVYEDESNIGLVGSRQRNKFYSSLHVNNNEFALLTPGKFWEDFLAEVLSELGLKG